MVNFEDVMDCAIAINSERRRHMRANAAYMSVGMYAREFCTVSVNVGRQTGKTTWITKSASSSDLVVVLNRVCGDIIGRSCRAKVVTLADIDRFLIGKPPVRYSRIYVDDASFIGCLDKVYHSFAMDLDQTFLFLG